MICFHLVIDLGLRDLEINRRNLSQETMKGKKKLHTLFGRRQNFEAYSTPSIYKPKDGPALRRGATVDGSPAFQGRERVSTKTVSRVSDA
jgi:hypothetical protein